MDPRDFPLPYGRGSVWSGFFRFLTVAALIGWRAVMDGWKGSVVADCGVLLVNLGTPDSTRVSDVRRYLKEFLLDPRVIDLPTFQRNLLVRGVILPFRPRKSAEAYKKIWTKEGSPLLVHGRRLAEKMDTALGDTVCVELGMRYGNPSIRHALSRLRDAGANRIIVLPLFPQYSSAAWGSAVEKVFDEAGRLNNVPSLSIVPPFFNHPAFIRAFAAVASPVLKEFKADRVVMSFHGLPERHLIKGDDSGGAHCMKQSDCCATITSANRNCYRAQCVATGRALAAAMDLADDDYDVTFQSRLGRAEWIRPYTDEHIRELAKRGVKRLAVLSPAFVADCLETTEELGMRAAEDFVAHGGEELGLVPSLNSEPVWIDAVVELLKDFMTQVPEHNPGKNVLAKDRQAVG